MKGNATERFTLNERLVLDVYEIPRTDADMLWPFYSNREHLDGFHMLDDDTRYLLERGLIERTAERRYVLTQAGMEVITSQIMGRLMN
jgi:hypothetical protein